MSPSVDSAEVSQLAARYGAPLTWARALPVSQQLVRERQTKNAHRRGEVVFAMPRPGHRVLVHTKRFYPPGTYRLLSGGIGMGEAVETAAAREILEETSLDAALARFLGIVEYEFMGGDTHAEFVSYVFLTTKTTGMPRVLDVREQIADFQEVSWIELGQVADRLENLPDNWHDWGTLRAIPHRLVIQAIQDLGLQL